METLNTVGSIASLVSLALTVWVAWEVRRLRTFYIRQLIVPGRAAELQRLTTLVSNAVDDKNATTVIPLVNKVDALLERLDEHADQTARSRITECRKLARRVLSESNDQLALDIATTLRTAL